MINLFVYGLMKKGKPNHSALEGAEFSINKVLHKHVIYGTRFVYPVMIYTGNPRDYVIGEIYKITLDKKEELDHIERGFNFTKVDTDLHSYIMAVANLEHYEPLHNIARNNF